MRRKRDILAHILHGALGGVLTSLYGYFGLAAAAFLFAQFIAYEWAEETKLKDEMYHELKEWSAGYAVSLTLTAVITSIV